MTGVAAGEALDLGGLDHDIGIDAFALDRAARRRVVARGGEAHRAVVRELDDGLHRAFAEGARAHEHGAMVVLQRAGHDLRGGGRAAVDQHHHREPAGGVLVGCRIEALRALHLAATDRDDLALVDEGVRNRHGLLQQAARVVAEIEHVAQQLVAGLLLQRLERVDETHIGLLVEAGDPDIADVGALEVRLHRLDLDVGAGELHVEGLAALAADRELDIAVDGTAHLLHGLVQRQSLHLLAVDLHDVVVRLDPGARGGRVVDRRDDLDEAVLHGDLDAEAAELAAHLRLQVAKILRIEIARVRIERAQHAVDGGLDELLVVRLLDIVGADTLQHLSEEIELAIDLLLLLLWALLALRGGRLRLSLRGVTRNQEPNQGCGGCRCNADTHHPLTFSSRVANHGNGFIGWPLWRSSR